MTYSCRLITWNEEFVNLNFWFYFLCFQWIEWLNNGISHLSAKKDHVICRTLIHGECANDAECAKVNLQFHDNYRMFEDANKWRFGSNVTTTIELSMIAANKFRLMDKTMMKSEFESSSLHLHCIHDSLTFTDIGCVVRGIAVRRSRSLTMNCNKTHIDLNIIIWDSIDWHSWIGNCYALRQP